MPTPYLSADKLRSVETKLQRARIAPGRRSLWLLLVFSAGELAVVAQGDTPEGEWDVEEMTLVAQVPDSHPNVNFVTQHSPYEGDLVLVGITYREDGAGTMILRGGRTVPFSFHLVEHEERGGPPLSAVLTITAGHSVTTDDGSGFNVPKQDVVATLVMLTQTGSLKIAQGLELAGELLEELQGFRLKVNLDTAHESYEAKAGAHDDLVIAVALACWYAEQDPTMSRLSAQQDGKPIWQADEEANEYDPLAKYRRYMGRWCPCP